MQSTGPAVRRSRGTDPCVGEDVRDQREDQAGRGRDVGRAQPDPRAAAGADEPGGGGAHAEEALVRDGLTRK